MIIGLIIALFQLSFYPKIYYIHLKIITDMKIILDIKDDKFPFFMEVLKNFPFVKAETFITSVTPKKSNKKRLSDKYKGVFSKEDAKSFNAHTKEMRKEWDNT